MNLLALVIDDFGGQGGIAQYNRDLLSALATDDFRVLVVPRHASSSTHLPKLIRQWKARPGRLAYSLATLTAALSERPDIVFCGHLYMASLAWLAARLSGAKLVMQMHGIEAWPRPSYFARAMVESADMVLCVSRYTRARVLNWAATAPERVKVLPNTVNERFSPGDGSALRVEWDLEGKRVLLTVGRMAASERYKGQDRVIAVLPALCAAGHDVVYVIAGEGDDRPRLEALALETGVAERVKFVGALSSERLVAACRMADLFVMPSTGEGFGIAFLEAMSCGTPTLGLADAGAIDALGDGELGSATTESNLYAAIMELLDAPRPEPQNFAQGVRKRFGREVFTARAAATFRNLSRAA